MHLIELGPLSYSEQTLTLPIFDIILSAPSQCSKQDVTTGPIQ